PPLMPVMTALVIALVLGLGLTAFKNSTSLKVAQEFRSIIEVLIRKVSVPALPLFIFGIFLDLSKSGDAIKVVSTFMIVVVLSFVLTAVVLVLQYTVAGAIAGVNPFKALWNMRDAYATALGTSSSAA